MGIKVDLLGEWLRLYLSLARSLARPLAAALALETIIWTENN